MRRMQSRHGRLSWGMPFPARLRRSHREHACRVHPLAATSARTSSSARSAEEAALLAAGRCRPHLRCRLRREEGERGAWRVDALHDAGVQKRNFLQRPLQGRGSCLTTHNHHHRHHTDLHRHRDRQLYRPHTLGQACVRHAWIVTPSRLFQSAGGRFQFRQCARRYEDTKIRARLKSAVHAGSRRYEDTDLFWAFLGRRYEDTEML